LSQSSSKRCCIATSAWLRSRHKEGKTRQLKTRAYRDGGAKTRKWRYSEAKPADSQRFNQTKSQLLNKHPCQENILGSVEIYQLFKNIENKKSAQEVHFATSKTGK
jgi:hypothetical protein